jgi:hypothetical protein
MVFNLQGTTAGDFSQSKLRQLFWKKQCVLPYLLGRIHTQVAAADCKVLAAVVVAGCTAGGLLKWLKLPAAHRWYTQAQCTCSFLSATLPQTLPSLQIPPVHTTHHPNREEVSTSHQHDQKGNQSPSGMRYTTGQPGRSLEALHLAQIPDADTTWCHCCHVVAILTEAEA